MATAAAAAVAVAVAVVVAVAAAGLPLVQPLATIWQQSILYNTTLV